MVVLTKAFRGFRETKEFGRIIQGNRDILGIIVREKGVALLVLTGTLVKG